MKTLRTLKKGSQVKNKKTMEITIATKERFGSRSFTDPGFFEVIHQDWEVIKY